MVHSGRRLEDASVDLPAKEGDTLDVDAREHVLDSSSTADGEHNLVRLLVNAQVVVRRPHSFAGLSVEDVLGFEVLHQVADHRLVGAVSRCGVHSVPQALTNTSAS